jgi:two-component system, cell cycle response regulator
VVLSSNEPKKGKAVAESLPFNVTVVSSSPEIKRLYASTLRSIGAICSWQNSLQALLQQKPAAIPNIVLLDLDSETEPLQLFSGEVRALFPSADWLALSGHDSAQTAVKCLRAGFADFLVKPMNPGELAWAVLRCQQRRQARDEWEQSPTRLLEAIKDMSACSSSTLLRITALQFVRRALSCRQVHWISKQPEHWKAEQSVPSLGVRPKKIEGSPKFSSGAGPKFFASKKWFWMPSRIFKGEGILATGLNSRPKAETIKEVRSLIDHLELSHANLNRLEQMRQQSFLDDLTGLYNARYLRHCLDRAVSDHKRRNEAFCVLFIDVDKFKHVNDSHGHLVGSQLLKALGKSLKNILRTHDEIFRYGGDEFVVLLTQTQLPRAIQIAERVRRMVEKRLFTIENASLQITLSIGVATYPDHAHTTDALLQLADQAMYDAKKKSRNAVQARPTATL